MKIKMLTILLFLLASTILAQTTGRITGTVKDQRDALVVGAKITVTNQATGEERANKSDAAGNFAFASLAPGIYRVRVEADGFNAFVDETIAVSITETTSLTVVLSIAGVVVNPITVNTDAPLVKTDNPALGQVFDARTITNLPLPNRNFTQLLGLTAGTTTYLTDSTVVGRNTQNVSVNGARVAQNNFQINGVEANAGISNGLQLANPALESIAEFKVQTSVYDATFGREGGGSIQVITKSGSNKFSGTVYDYFRNASLMANNPFLKAADVARPVLERNVFGFALGGAIRKDRAFFFGSFQTTRDRNGISRQNSLSVNVLIDPRLTDDRSDATLQAIFGNIHPVARRLLQARLLNGQFVIPTPNTAGGLYNGSAISLFDEQQFNANLDFRLSSKNWLSLKFFYSDAPQILAQSGGTNIPGFPEKQNNSNRIFSLQDIQTFGANITNEARFGWNFIRGDSFPSQPVLDTALGITRPNQTFFPGLPLLGIAGAAGGVQFGTGINQDLQINAPTTSFADTVSITRGKHFLRFGAEIRFYKFNFYRGTITRGFINFQTFPAFLNGTNTNVVGIANGIGERNLRSADYNFFVQDDWKISPKLTLNLGLRYELDLPPFDTKGRIAAFDASFYQPPTALNTLPVGGIVQAGNPFAGYDLPEIPNVGKRVLYSNDPNNFAPRIGLAFSPFKSNRIVFRGGYGIFYSRLSFQYLAGNQYLPPFYLAQFSAGTDLSAPFPFVPSADQFPDIFPGILVGNSFDRRNRTPYLHQYNAGVQIQLSPSTLLEIAYVGTRGTEMIRRAAVNQANLASEMNPIRNIFTGVNIMTNTPFNAQIRAPYQGVSVSAGGVGFLQDQTTAESNYNSAQLTLTRRFSRGLQFLASYTFGKSIDNASGTGGGAGTSGILDGDTLGDTAQFDGDQRSKNSNRGVSDFDRTHRFVLSFVWELPAPKFGSKLTQALLSNWQISGIVTAMSGLPINIRDSRAAELFFGQNGGGDRPSWVAGVSPTENIPPGYFFNPYAFRRPLVLAGQIIPSSTDGARAGAGCPILNNAFCTDFGSVGRNPLRGPNQFNTDFSTGRRFRIDDAKNIEFRVEIFNVFNQVNFANPISNLNAVPAADFEPDTGRIRPGRAGNFGKIISTSNNPRIIQLVVKFNF